jgi:hypothetical protein
MNKNTGGKTSIGVHGRGDTYATKMAPGRWRLYSYSPSHGMYVAGAREVSYSEACQAVREARRLEI